MGLDNPIHILFLLIVLLLVFGAKRLPELGHSLGSGLRGFKEAIGGEDAHTPPQSALQVTAQPQAHPVDAQPVAVRPVAPVASVSDDRAA